MGAADQGNAGAQVASPSDRFTAPSTERLAVIYVHGMGDQWRLADPASIVNSLEEYARIRLTSTPHHCTLPSGNGHAYLEIGLPNRNHIDFHEVYWAPASPPVTPTNVLRWLQKQLLVPFLRLHAPWARLTRLRLGVLGQAVVTGRFGNKASAVATPIETAYKTFVAANPQGTFKGFLAGGDQTFKGAAKQWHAQARSNDWTAIWVVLSLILMTLVFALLVTEATLSLLKFLQVQPLADWATRYGLNPAVLLDQWYITPLIVMTFVVSLGWIFGISPFFQKFLGDAVQWATYHETSEGYAVRKAILTLSSEVFEHVLSQGYDRVVVLAHSLGSVIAHDTLLYLRDDPKLIPGLQTVSHFLTYGSPIDKFAYFFEAQQGQTPRYEQTVNDLRGSVFQAPFRRDLVWQNFYEEGDPISGTIHTVGPTWQPQGPPRPAILKNIYAANANVALVAPNHTGYTRNRLVLASIWNALIPGCSPPGTETTAVDVMAHTRWMRQMYAVTLLIPWALLASYVAHGAHLIQSQVQLEPNGQSTDVLWWGLRWGFGVSALLLGFSFLKPVHLLKPLAVALTALTLIGMYAAYTAPTQWVNVPPAGGVTAQQQQCEAKLSGTPPNFALEGTCKEPIPERYTPASLSWGTNPWSIVLGLSAPAALTAMLLLVTKYKSIRQGKKAEAQTHERPNTLLPWILSVIVAFIAISTAQLADGQASLPWWWWRTTLLYATFSLLAITVGQFVWQKNRLEHMLKL